MYEDRFSNQCEILKQVLEVVWPKLQICKEE